MNIFKKQSLTTHYFKVLVVSIIAIITLYSVVVVYNGTREARLELYNKVNETAELASLSLSDNLWNYNEEAINQISKAIMNNEEMTEVVVKNTNGRVISQLMTEDMKSSNHKITLAERRIYHDGELIGSVTVGITTKYRESILFRRSMEILVEALLMIVLLTLISSRIAVHLAGVIRRLRDSAEEITEGNLSHRVVVESEDEIGQIAEIFNTLTVRLTTLIDERDAANEKLEAQQFILEQQVKERTEELFVANQDLVTSNETLWNTMEALRATQTMLIQTEKVAAMGSIVAGIAHEINTPLGNALTVVTYLKNEAECVFENYQEKKLTKKEFMEFLESIVEIMNTIERNLTRLNKLIQTFKNMTNDELIEDTGALRLREIIERVSEEYISNSGGKPLVVHVNCPSEMTVNASRGFLDLIIRNLLNYMMKSFHSVTEICLVNIQVEPMEGGVKIVFHNEALYLESSVLEHLLEPFFTAGTVYDNVATTDLFIVYTIVVRKLQGNIECISSESEGTSFIIQIPESVEGIDRGYEMEKN